VDTVGFLHKVYVTAANCSDRDGAKKVLGEVSKKCRKIQVMWADRGYSGLENWILNHCNSILLIVKRPKGSKGFVLLPRRWVVERTFAWLGRNRRLSKAYDFLTTTSKTWMSMANVALILKRLARFPKPRVFSEP
jgi:putative transposase